MPRELLDKVLSTQKFNQGFATTEYLAASILDQALHQLTPEQVPAADKVMEFEENALESAGIALNTVPPRYRSSYFSHIMGGYSAAYYSYIWSEVLDADTVEWFKEKRRFVTRKWRTFSTNTVVSWRKRRSDVCVSKFPRARC